VFPGGPARRSFAEGKCSFVKGKLEMKVFDAHIKRFDIDLAWSVLLRVRVGRVRLLTHPTLPGMPRKSLSGAARGC
jgi:hypothetical protein